MSDNETFISNTTNITFYAYPMPAIFNLYTGSVCINLGLGTIFNLWFLVAILTYQDLRSRFRNKIICSGLVLQLVDSAICLPAMLGFVFRGYRNCILYSSLDHLKLIQDFIGNWLLVMILVVFIAQIKDFNPSVKLTPRAITLGTIGLLILPWVASLIIVPVIIHEELKSLPWANITCNVAVGSARRIIKCLDIAVPLLLAIILVIVAAFLKYKRFQPVRGSTRSMQVELISREPEIDSILPYVVVTFVFILTDFLMLFIEIGIIMFWTSFEQTFWYSVIYSSFILSDFRVIFTPLMWLLLPDIRHRIKTWRPWYRRAPGIDWTFAYSKEMN